jgi:hypothetical protein
LLAYVDSDRLDAASINSATTLPVPQPISATFSPGRAFSNSYSASAV